MTMSSYEVVCRAVEFGGPDRLPLKLEEPVALPSFGIVESDVATVRWNFRGTGDHSLREDYDEWGCRWVRTSQENMGQIKSHPLANWNEIDTYRWPDANDAAYYTGVDERLRRHEGKYIETHLFMLLWERMQALRGFENILLDIMLHRDRAELLADRIVEYDLAVIDNLARRFGTDIHGFWVTEDWGTQQALMINPLLWRTFFKPRYKVIFDAAHQAGWHIWMHSDGYINDIIEDLLELGIDVLNLQQPLVNGIEKIGARFAGRVAFESSCDIQKTLPSADEKIVREEAEKLLRNWTIPEGGFILSIDDNREALGISDANTVAMLDAFLTHSPW